MKDHYSSSRVVAARQLDMPALFVHASHPTAERARERGRGRGAKRNGEKERGGERMREDSSRVSGSLGRVTERFRVPLAPALTRLPDTVTSLIRE